MGTPVKMRDTHMGYGLDYRYATKNEIKAYGYKVRETLAFAKKQHIRRWIYHLLAKRYERKMGD